MSRNIITIFTKYTKHKKFSNEVLSCFFKDQILLASDQIGFKNANFYYCSYNDEFLFHSEWNSISNYNEWCNTNEIDNLHKKYLLEVKSQKIYNKYHLFDDVFLL